MNTDNLMRRIKEVFKDGRMVSLREVSEIINSGVAINSPDYKPMAVIKSDVFRLERELHLTRRVDDGIVKFRITKLSVSQVMPDRPDKS